MSPMATIQTATPTLADLVTHGQRKWFAKTTKAGGVACANTTIPAGGANSGARGVALVSAPEPTMTTHFYYNYAVVDAKYPGEPHYWALSGFSFGDASTDGWTFEFAPEATKTTQLLKSNLARKKGRISLAVTHSEIPTKEPRWSVGTTWDQLLITMDADTAAHRKIGFYKLKVLKLSRETDSFRHRIFRAPTKVLLCQIGGSGYVAGDG